MKRTKEQKSKNKTPKTNNGITLIALVITIIVMLILVGVTISMAVNGGLFDYAGKAVGDMNNAMLAEQQLANGGITIAGKYYNSIDEYLGVTGGEDEEEESLVKITLNITGTDVTEVPVPTGFTHIEGSTIEDGYVITDELDENGKVIGNEFVWVPVKQGQKITLKVESEKEIHELKLYDPYGEEINLGTTAGDIGKTYNNTQIEPTINGMYFAVVSTPNGTNEDGTPKYEITQEKLKVKSLYAMDTWNDWYTSDEYAKTLGFDNYEAYALDAVKNQFGLDSVELALQMIGCPTFEVADTKLRGQLFLVAQITDIVDYSANVESNGGFYIGRYEAGAATQIATPDSDATVQEIINTHGKPVSQIGYYPYNNLSFTQIRGLAESMYNSDEFTDTLVTNSAWYRTLGWIYETSSIEIEKFLDSLEWGNYKKSDFTITRGEYSEDNGKTYKKVSEEATETYKKEENIPVLLTTGATSRNYMNKIFDLAGNVNETMLATIVDPDYQEEGPRYYSKDGSYLYGSEGMMIELGGADADNPRECTGFRSALYLSVK